MARNSSRYGSFPKWWSPKSSQISFEACTWWNTMYNLALRILVAGCNGQGLLIHHNISSKVLRLTQWKIIWQFLESKPLPCDLTTWHAIRDRGSHTNMVPLKCPSTTQGTIRWFGSNNAETLCAPAWNWVIYRLQAYICTHTEAQKKHI